MIVDRGRKQRIVSWFQRTLCALAARIMTIGRFGMDEHPFELIFSIEK